MAKKNEISLDTFIPELPNILQNKFNSLNRYIDTFYDRNNEIIIAPINTTGNVRGAKAEFATAVIENLVVRNQFTNLYANSNTADLDFVNTYNGNVVETRAADPSVLELDTYDYVDVTKSYYKIDNTKSYAFQTDTLAQEFQLIFDTSVASPSNPYTILLDPSTNTNGQQELIINDSTEAEKAWFKLICYEVDPSWGASWTIKQYGGNYTINNT